MIILMIPLVALFKHFLNLFVSLSDIILLQEELHALQINTDMITDDKQLLQNTRVTLEDVLLKNRQRNLKYIVILVYFSCIMETQRTG